MSTKRKLTYSIDPTKNLICIECVEQFCLDDLRDHAARLTSDPRFKAGMDELIDLSRASFNGGYDEARQYRDFIESTQRLRGESRWAIVAPTDGMYGLSRMFGMLTEGLGIKIKAFRSRVSALAWLAKNREP